MTCKTQKQAILAHVKQKHFITRMDAFRECACCNLWQRIAELEQDGYRFDRRIVITRNGKRVMQYWLRASRQEKAA